MAALILLEATLILVLWDLWSTNSLGHLINNQDNFIGIHLLETIIYLNTEISNPFHPTYRYPAIGIRYLDREKVIIKTRKVQKKELKMLAVFFPSVKVQNKLMILGINHKIVHKEIWNLFRLAICQVIRQIQIAAEWTIPFL